MLRDSCEYFSERLAAHVKKKKDTTEKRTFLRKRILLFARLRFAKRLLVCDFLRDSSRDSSWRFLHGDR